MPPKKKGQAHKTSHKTYIDPKNLPASANRKGNAELMNLGKRNQSEDYSDLDLNTQIEPEPGDVEDLKHGAIKKKVQIKKKSKIAKHCSNLKKNWMKI